MAKKTKTLSQLRKEADKYFSKYVRYRDAERVGDNWYAECITCGVKKNIKDLHAGHFMSRRFSITRYEEENVNAQCALCNTYRAGEQYLYYKALKAKYGDDVPDRLEVLTKQAFKPTRDWYEQIISDAKEQIKFYESDKLI